MKVPPMNNVNGVNGYEDDHYFPETVGGPVFNAAMNGNGDLEEPIMIGMQIAFPENRRIGGPFLSPTMNGNGGLEEYIPNDPQIAPAQDPAPRPDPVPIADFSEYMWMENEEEFDKEVLARLEEEELMEQCMIRHMLDDEVCVAPPNNFNPAENVNNTNQAKEIQEPSEMAKSSTLNPHAQEFIPSWRRSPEHEKQS